MKLLIAGSGSLMGAVGGIAGVVAGVKHLKREARSIEELDAINRFARASVGLVMLAATLSPISWAMTHRPISQVLVFTGFIGGLAGLHMIWLPRLLRDRHVLEALEDPVRAARARRMEWRTVVLALTLGAILGGLGILVGVILGR
jgi:hypothetical protein